MKCIHGISLRKFCEKCDQGWPKSQKEQKTEWVVVPRNAEGDKK